jgi:hypothetical protein
MTRIALAVIAALAVLTGCQTTSTKSSAAADEAAAAEGLVRAESKTVDALYRRPEANFSGYTKLLLRPIEVQFSKNWDPANSGSALYRMNEPDREKIKSELAELFLETFKRDVQEKGGYNLVTEPGPDVLEMRAAIVNLYINAPDVSMQTAGRTRTYTTDAGEMTLIAQLHDSVTGQLLVRAFDRRASTGTGTWTWTNSVTNSTEARRIISTWATALRKALDAAHGKA